MVIVIVPRPRQFNGHCRRFPAIAKHALSDVNYTTAWSVEDSKRFFMKEGIQSEGAAMREFHDTFLSYGGPSIPLVRQQMMGETKPQTLFPAF